MFHWYIPVARQTDGGDLAAAPYGSQVQIAGVIHAVKLKNNKSGKRDATFWLEDREGAAR